MALALAPFALVAIGARVVVARIGDGMARRFEAVADVRVTVGSATSDPEDDVVDQEQAPPVGSSVAQRSGARDAGAPKGIVVSAARLAGLTAKQLRRVRATTAVDEQGRPLGARLSGVGALGVGLEDGDVVTSIDGRPTPTADDATAAAMAAWSSGERTVHATILRAGQTIAVTVQIPVIDAGP